MKYTRSPFNPSRSSVPHFYQPNLWCGLLGHHVEEKIWPVGSSSIACKWKDELGNGILYHMRLCLRCGKRIPIDAENAAEKERGRQAIAAVMNGSRARLGLPPLAWDD